MSLPGGVQKNLLVWCQQATFGYPGVRISTFTDGFTNGLAFAAIIHRYRPDLIDYEALFQLNGVCVCVCVCVFIV